MRQTASADEASMGEARAHAARVSPGTARVDQIEAGCRWLRLERASTAARLWLRPVRQALRENLAMAGTHDEILARYARPGETVQTLGRLTHWAGHGGLAQVLPSQRVAGLVPALRHLRQHLDATRDG